MQAETASTDAKIAKLEAALETERARAEALEKERDALVVLRGFPARPRKL
jgi:hypothetical protein